MKRIITTLLGILVIQWATAQVGPSNKSLAEEQISQLKGGTLVVRLKSNEKSIRAYRAAGKEKLAKKLETENRLTNLHLMRAFLLNFSFCKLLFINAGDTRKLLDHEPYIFLNEKLQVDSSITFSGDSMFFAEYGTALGSQKSGNYTYDLSRTQEATTPATTSALVISDTALTQLREPFPYYAVVNITSSAYIIPSNPDKPSKSDKRTPYERAASNLNSKMIDYFAKVWLKRGKYMTQEPGWWAENNPNKNIASRTRALYNEIIETLDSIEQFKSH